MSEFMYVMKMLFVTLVVVLLLQVRVGEITIEQHSHAWLQTSPVVNSLRGVSEGAVKALQTGYVWMSSTFDTNASRIFKGRADLPGHRQNFFGMKRSDEFQNAEKEKKMKREQESERATMTPEAVTPPLAETQE